MIPLHEIEKLAALSRITLSPDEIKTMGGEIDSILSYINQIKEVSDRAGAPEKADVRNIFRDDTSVIEASTFTEEIMANAPQKENGFIKVKQILS